VDEATIAYWAKHHSAIQGGLDAAVNAVMTQLSDEPLAAIGRHLIDAAPTATAGSAAAAQCGLCRQAVKKLNICITEYEKAAAGNAMAVAAGAPTPAGASDPANATPEPEVLLSPEQQAEHDDVQRLVETEEAGEWTIGAWMKSLPLVGLVADAMGSPHTSEEPLAHAKSLDFETAKRLLRAADIEGKLARRISEASALLRQGAMTATALNAKFANEASFELAVGNLDVFYGGLEKLVGPPRMTQA
jgi:hypothetical protein